MGDAEARRQRVRLRHGFTLAETLVALALVGLVILPATVAFHRLLEADRRLRDDLEAELLVRHVLEQTALDLHCGLAPEAVRVTYPAGSGVRVVARVQPAEADRPAAVSVAASRGTSVSRSAHIAVPPAPSADEPPTSP